MDKDTRAKLAATAAMYRVGKSALASACIQHSLHLKSKEFKNILRYARQKFDQRRSKK